MAMTTLEEKFVHDLGDIYDAEHRFLEAQREMMQQAKATELKTMIREHIAQTEEQIRNLDQVYQTIGAKAKRVKCDAANGLVIEGQKGMKEAADQPALLDCVIANTAAKVEHYEIATYRGLITLCEGLGQSSVLNLLVQNLQQEEQTAQRVEQSLPQLVQKVSKQRAVAR
ncbi:MAG: ferritin-like domain-containing protein [Chloroflexales bacterium]|nr:ferritin-like domain-containing protein [Chloroflexales bacterium]